MERSAATFDVLGAESVGQIGYVLAQAMASEGTIAVPIVTQVVVDPQHEAFRNPTKFVGPVYVLCQVTRPAFATCLSRDLTHSVACALVEQIWCQGVARPRRIPRVDRGTSTSNVL